MHYAVLYNERSFEVLFKNIQTIPQASFHTVAIAAE